MVGEGNMRFSNQSASIVEDERAKIRALFLRRLLFIILCAVILPFVMGLCLSMGSAKITFNEVYAAIFSRVFPGFFEVRSLVDKVVWQLRMPRILMAALAGATLAMAGCTTQALLRNPLATPYTLGISAGAGFGAAIGFILSRGLVFGGALQIVGNAFIFSLIPAAVVLLVAKKYGAMPETMILSGIAMAYIFSACNTLLQFFAEAEALRATVFWLIGDLSRAAWWQLPYTLAVLLLFALINMRMASAINIVKMGDEDAKGLGVDAEKVRKLGIITACLATATVVSFTGAIGFICLLAPHISRIVIGEDLRYLIPASGLVGSNLLLVADLIARRAIAPAQLPVGAITALLGGPLLLYLLIRQRRRTHF